ncbi:MAG TPA: transposase [Lactovum miscens]|uniref:transposase n=1 Tax=Lactovum miscens TaxID=190387 RepID=UPI002ED9BF3F
MLHKQDNLAQIAFILSTLDDLMPQEHYLREIAHAVDFKFIYDLLAPLYDLETGWPSLDPVLLIKLPLLQYLEGIKRLRETVKQVQVNVAYRWFLGLSLEDEVPHFSTFGKNYTRRFEGTDLFEQIFFGILAQCQEAGFVDSRTLFIDGTHIKAHASNHKFEKVKVPKEALLYHEQLKAEIREERVRHELKALKNLESEEVEIKEKKISHPDPESGWFHKREHKEVLLMWHKSPAINMVGSLALRAIQGVFMIQGLL